uniref:SCP domain-containing protein n=2 Tax=Mesocestoides corti TaxID=53468 RepID=A0A5K3G6V8_MESCO
MHKIICLLALVGHVLATVPSYLERGEIIAKLTKIRQDVQPPASNMNMLSYSEEMEKLASDWLTRCSFGYPSPSTYPAFNGTGMLLRKVANSRLRFQVVSYAAKQAKNYKYDDNTCSGSCKKYKLLVWAASTEVGCAIAKCPDQNTSKDLYYMACVFNHA